MSPAAAESPEAMITNATQVISHDPGEVIAIAGLNHQPGIDTTDTDIIVGGVRYSTRYQPTSGTTIVTGDSCGSSPLSQRGAPQNVRNIMRLM